MARNSTWIPVGPEAVWSVLADAFAYPDWVVGASHVFAADPSWPEPGTRLHHRVGVGPVGTRDRTRVQESDAPRRLVLDAAARPFGRARVELVLRAEDGGTRVHLFEDPAGFTSLLRFNPVLQLALKVRNAESLRRLRDAAERRERAIRRAERRSALSGRAAAAG